MLPVAYIYNLLESGTVFLCLVVVAPCFCLSLAHRSADGASRRQRAALRAAPPPSPKLQTLTRYAFAQSAFGFHVPRACASDGPAPGVSKQVRSAFFVACPHLLCITAVRTTRHSGRRPRRRKESNGLDEQSGKAAFFLVRHATTLVRQSLIFIKDGSRLPRQLLHVPLGC